MSTFFRYERLEKIAAGSFAVVYRGRDRELRRDVAIKQIHAQFLADGQQLTNYWQEAQLLASLPHPHVLTIYDIVRSRGWLVLERMHGSLERECHGEGIDLDYLRAVLRDCLQALRFLHANGVIHGDVKPSNLLLDAQGRVKVAILDCATSRQQRDRQPFEGDHEVHGPGGGVGAVRPGWSVQRSVLAGLFGL